MTDTTENSAVQSTDEWAQNWSEMLQHAHTRPRLFIGPQETAHRRVTTFPFRLMWQANLFRHPQKARIDLSPHHCVIRLDAGSLIRPVQETLSFPGERVPGDAWREKSRAEASRFHADEEARGLPFDDVKYKCSWRYAFSGPTGPRLEWVAQDAVLAHSLTWGVRTDQGLWCQAYANGWPSGAPFLIETDSPVGLIVLIDLDPHWWIGLPYSAMDVAQLVAASHKAQGLDDQWKPEPPWSTGKIEAVWHEADDLVTEKSLTAEGVREWLQADNAVV